MNPALKICGVTEAAFAVEAARRGVDCLGLIFAASSPRRVSVAAAREIAAAARSASPPAARVRMVGVFAGQTYEEMSRTAATVPLDIVQLHGGYGLSDVAALKAAGLEVWRLADATETGRGDGDADALLLDGCVGGRCGGTGSLADWSRVAELKRAGWRVVLAGGLSAENIKDAAATGADVLDVNSSLETSPGVKSVQRLWQLLQALGDRSQ